MINALLELLSNSYHCGDLAQMEVIASTLLHAIPDDIVSMQFLGLVYYRKGKLDSAINLFSRARGEKQSSHVDMKRTTEGHKIAAAACYFEATLPSTQLADGWYEVGVTLHGLGQLEQAVSAYRAAIAARPDFPEAIDALNSLVQLCGDLDDAVLGKKT